MTWSPGMREPSLAIRAEQRVQFRMGSCDEEWYLPEFWRFQ